MLSPDVQRFLQRVFPPSARRHGPPGYSGAAIVACLVIGCRLKARVLRHVVRLPRPNLALVQAAGLRSVTSVATWSRRLRAWHPGLFCFAGG